MENTRNFCIIAHIDAGKSTLADRLMEMTGTVAMRDMQEQLLDSNPIERERGITIKMAPVSMNYHGYRLNLIDTPGHVDFNYEVERALQACEGAILLIDATKGVQAQTVANYHLAKKQGLTIIPAINKADAQLADVDSCIRQVKQLLGSTDTPLSISAKTGLNVDLLLQQVIDQIPSPANHVISSDEHLRALIFNSTFHPHLGVIAFVRIFSGAVSPTSQLEFMSTGQKFIPAEVGIFNPSRLLQDHLSTGQVGYLITGLKDIRLVKVGDTVTQVNAPATSALPGYRVVRPNVYFDIFPAENQDYQNLLDALGKLKLNDAALETKNIKSLVLGQGVRVGFLGLLHAEVVGERLEQEFNLPVITTSPSVEYHLKLRSGESISLNTANDFPDPVQILSAEEPLALVNVVVKPDYLGPVLDTCQELRGQLLDMVYLDSLVELSYSMPLIEVITSLHDRLKSVSSGFASINYEPSGWQSADLVKLTVLLNHEEVAPLSTICIQSQAQHRANSLAKRLKESIPRQMFEIPVQICVGGSVIAREDIKAFRKDVTAKLYGGDRTRRMKLLEKQKKGKARMKMMGKVAVPQEAFLAAVKSTLD